MPERTSDPLASRIITIRGQRVVLDADLARLYGVPTKRFNEAVKRNASRFPRDFAFQLTLIEFENLRSRSATSDERRVQTAAGGNWSQFATSSKATRRGKTYRPWAFTEHGAVMAANVLRSPKAVAMSVYVVRAFVRMREELLTSAVILKRLAEVDKKLVTHDVVSATSTKSFVRCSRPCRRSPPKKWDFTRVCGEYQFQSAGPAGADRRGAPRKKRRPARAGRTGLFAHLAFD